MTNAIKHKKLAKEGEKVPVWIARPFELVSFLKMYQVYGEVLFRTSQHLETLCCIHPEIEDEPLKSKANLRAILDIMLRDFRSIDLRVSALLIENIKEKLSRPKITHREVKALLEELQRRVYDELKSVTLMYLPPHQAKYYDDAPQFGEIVARRFQRVITDIQEAGKCLATGRYTASVFHLMRVMEGAVQHLGERLKINLVREKNWHRILEEVDKAIRDMTPKTSRQKEVRNTYSEASAYLRMVKDAWRNDTMHPKATYTEEEAERVFNNVKDFMVHLATKL